MTAVLNVPTAEEPQALLNAMDEMASELQRLWALEAEYKRVIGLAQELSEATARSLVKRAEEIAKAN